MRLILPPSFAACLTGALLTVAPAAAQDNRPPAGFVALFHGKDLTGWQGLVELPQRTKLTPEELKKAQQDANEKFLPHWTVRDGVLHYDGKGQSLQTAKDYGDFELLVDWKIGPKGDTGIYLRGTPQVQIWDRAEGSGGLYNNQKNPRNPIKSADKPVGEWNTFRIAMRGEIVTIWLNGELVVDKVPMENYWDRTKPIAPTGPIELQHHGNPIEFKNIYIKELK
jgi:3-keto-disaccharide hydrolase